MYILILLLSFLLYWSETTNKFLIKKYTKIYYNISFKFDVIRFSENPIINTNIFSLPDPAHYNIYNPCLIKTPKWIQHPLGKYYLYFASHLRGKKIYMAFSNQSLHGPWILYKNGVLNTLSTNSCDRGSYRYVSAPDIHIDEKRKKIIMYLSCFSNQNWPHNSTIISESDDGIHFDSGFLFKGPFYFRLFRYHNTFYALAKYGNIGGILLRCISHCLDKNATFEMGYDIVIPNMRHSSIFVYHDHLLVLYSKANDLQESIYLAIINTTSSWNLWNSSSQDILIMKPEKTYKGAQLKKHYSKWGPSPLFPVNQIRDPFVYIENKKIYLLYTVAGEKGIAIARLIIHNKIEY